MGEKGEGSGFFVVLDIRTSSRGCLCVDGLGFFSFLLLKNKTKGLPFKT
jgi:hypothetical protein